MQITATGRASTGFAIIWRAMETRTPRASVAHESHREMLARRADSVVAQAVNTRGREDVAGDDFGSNVVDLDQTRRN